MWLTGFIKLNHSRASISERFALLNWARDDIQEVEDGFLPGKFQRSGSEAFKRFNVPTIESLTPYQLRNLSAASTFLIAPLIFCLHFLQMRGDSFGYTSLLAG